jgi:hypothetical protein
MQKHDYITTDAAPEQRPALDEENTALEESAALDDFFQEAGDGYRDPQFAIPDLEAIPRDLWREALDPLHRQHRMWVACQLADEELRTEAVVLALELDFAEVDRRNARLEARHRARQTGAPLPTPGPDHPVRRGTMQVNMRLRRDDHARLTEAAAAVGLKPTSLARALVLNGAAQILRDHATG